MSLKIKKKLATLTMQLSLTDKLLMNALNNIVQIIQLFPLILKNWVTKGNDKVMIQL